MTVNRTTLLDLPLPVTGTESGTWGDTTNNGLTQYLDIAIAGTLVLSTDADVTLTSTEGDSSATNIGATTAQYAILRWTATGSTTRNITALAQSKTYVVINATGGTQSIVLRGAGPTTGVTIISGEKAFCVWNGSDFVKVSSSAAAGGSNTQVQYNSSGVLAGSSNMTFNGTKLTVAGFLDSALTSGRVPYATTSGELIDSANLLYSGTDLTVYGITVGRGAGAVVTNTVVGNAALQANTTGLANDSFGYQSLTSNTTGNENVGLAYQTLFANTTGAQNTAVGSAAIRSNTSGNYNTGVGYRALYSNTTASNNTAVGYQAGYSNTTGDVNVFMGRQAGYGNTTGAANNAFGDLALYTNSTGASNNALGRQALYFNTTGNYNTALGHTALYSNTTASNNTAVGYQAGYSGTTGTQNTYLGTQAGYSNLTSNNNTFVGYYAGNATTGTLNTFIGNGSGYLVSSGAKNTIVGVFSGNQGGLDIRTSNNYIVLSDGDGNPRLAYNGSGVGFLAAASTSTCVFVSGVNQNTLGSYYGEDVDDRSFWINYNGYQDGATRYRTFKVADGKNNSVLTVTGSTRVVKLDYGQLEFPATQNASSNANTLDDYEEGTFTATIAPSTSGTITLNSGVDLLAYTKIGRVVYVQGLLEVSSVSSPVGNNVYVQNLPFAIADLSEYAGRGGTACVVVASVRGIQMYEGDTKIYVLVDASTIISGSQFYLSFNYIAA